MSLRKIAGLLVAFGLVVGVVGGAGATFSSSVTGDQKIAVGNMTITLDNPIEVTCPLITVNSAHGTAACPGKVNIDVVGGIVPDKLVLHVDVFGAAEPGKFVMHGLFAGTEFTRTLESLNGDGVVVTSPTFPDTFVSEYSWSNLENASMGNAITVRFTITATED